MCNGVFTFYKEVIVNLEEIIEKEGVLPSSRCVASYF